MIPAIDPRALRDAFGCFMTGVTVVTTIDTTGQARGFTANSFTSVSLDPALLLVSIANNSANLAAFAGGSGFAVNILSEGQKEVSATFARPVPDRFATVTWRRGPVGSPLIADVSAWFDCTLDRAVEAGDHTLLIGRVGAFEAGQAPGLGYHRGAYFTPARTAVQLPAGPDVVLSAIVECAGRVLLLDDGRGGLTLPMARVGRDGVQAALAGLIAATKMKAEPGSIYAVYDDPVRQTSHVAFRCPAVAGTPATGAMVDLTPAGVADVSDPATRIMLERLAEESRVGNYGLYFGTHEAGRVTRAGQQP